MSRGLLIAFEGLDRSGKSTQCAKLAANLKAKKIPTEFLRFPDRTTATGQLISRYLSDSSTSLSDQSIHLLFSANRWEAAARINDLLKAGTTVILDRYSPSGAVFSVAKQPPPFSWEWALAPEVGLPAPDLVIFLHVDGTVAAARGGYGEERYETSEMQSRVCRLFAELGSIWEPVTGGKWHQLDASKTIDEVENDITELVENITMESRSSNVKCIPKFTNEMFNSPGK